MTAIKNRLIDPLSDHRDRIAGCADRQSVPFVESTWRTWLGLAEIDDDVADRVFNGVDPGSVLREHVRWLSSVASTPEDRLVLLITVLIWGRGKRNGRMRDPIIKTLTHSDRDAVLAQTADLAKAGRAAEAYKAWGLPGLQAAFFTKWLWAATASTPERCCLILDSLVWSSLGTFGWNSIEAAGGSRRRATRYAAYVEDIHLCAAELEVRPEDVECALFRMKGDPDLLGRL